ncbi:SDR family oxidoreductase [Rhodotorula paludigena]|uniref:SDR family oxidoreductase n=1 Tax=Rhodotorula paludigena TaxID=86838 RepID=UPI003171A11C
MLVFVTGASGFVGTGVTKELLAHGYEVLGLARSAAAADKLRQLGAIVHEGSIDDYDSLKRGAQQADAVIHLAFKQDFENFWANCLQEGEVIKALGEALEGTNKPLIVTSGTAVLAGTRDPSSTAPITEHDPAPTDMAVMPRCISETASLAFSSRGVRVSVVRLPPSVHGRGDHASIPMLVDAARKAGAAGYIGEGNVVWPAVGRDDAAVLYRLALEKGDNGNIFHAVHDESVPFKSIAESIGKRMGLPVKSVKEDDAEAHFGVLAIFAKLSNPASAKWTSEKLGWHPKGTPLLEVINAGVYC